MISGKKRNKNSMEREFLHKAVNFDISQNRRGRSMV